MRSPLLEQFLTEGRDLIEEASGSLLMLERAPDDDEVVNQVFRSVHTLKGNSGLFEYPALTELLHAAEELMVRVRDKSIALTPDMVDALLAAADGVRTFLDEIDASEALTDASTQEGRRIAGLIAAFVDGGASSAQSAEEEVQADPLPEWAEGLGDVLEPTDDGPVVVFEYTPSDSCFFRGEDPIHLVSQLLEVRYRSVEILPDPPEDAYACHLRIRGVTSAPRPEVEHTFRYVDDEVIILNGPLPGEGAKAASAPSEGGDAGFDHGLDEALRGAAVALIEKQAAVVDAGGDAVVPSATEVLRRAMARLGDRVGLEELSGHAPKTTGDFREVQEGFRARYDASKAAQDQKKAAASGRAAAAGKAGKGDGPKEGGGGQSTASRTLRVDQHKVDRLMNLIGQLVVAKNGLPYIARRLETHGDAKMSSRELKEHSAVVDRISRELQAAIMEVRMLPVSQVFQRFPRLVRDVSRKLDKQIELSLVGEETQADKNVIEALSEPLVHLVRNSLDHGIEPPAERTAKGKSAQGQIRLSARNENETVVITIEDDGRGLDASMLRDKVVNKGIMSREDVDRLSDEDARMLIFAPGFSTKEQATDLSGRGVGMDVVRTTIEKAGGRVSLKSEVGVGTTFTLALPLSMAVSHVMTVNTDNQLYGIGMDSVVETVRCSSSEIRVIKGREAFVLREELIPVLRLRGLLSLHNERKLNGYGEEAVLVLRVGGESVGLVVDEFGENIEVLVRPLEGWMGDMKEYSGSAVLGDGRLLLVLDMKELMRNGG